MRLEKTDNDFILDFVIFITHLGDGQTLIMFALCFLGVLISQKHYRTSALWCLAVATSFVISTSLKLAFDKARPDEIYHLVHASSPAFPSGHALRSTVVYILAAIVISMVFKIKTGRKFVLLGAYLLAFSIGLSRILLGVHWFADVVAGWVIGLSLCGIFYAALAWPHSPSQEYNLVPN